MKNVGVGVVGLIVSGILIIGKFTPSRQSCAFRFYTRGASSYSSETLTDQYDLCLGSASEVGY